MTKISACFIYDQKYANITHAYLHRPQGKPRAAPYLLRILHNCACGKICPDRVYLLLSLRLSYYRLQVVRSTYVFPGVYLCVILRIRWCFGKIVGSQLSVVCIVTITLVVVMTIPTTRLQGLSCTCRVCDTSSTAVQ